VHQDGFSLCDYIEMHGQENIKFLSIIIRSTPVKVNRYFTLKRTPPGVDTC